MLPTRLKETLEFQIYSETLIYADDTILISGKLPKADTFARVPFSETLLYLSFTLIM